MRKPLNRFNHKRTTKNTPKKIKISNNSVYNLPAGAPVPKPKPKPTNQLNAVLKKKKK